jgi:uncharacterized membrane protein YkvA (DUF1232 family)
VYSCPAPLPTILSRAKTLLLDVPKHGKLAYCLLRDPRIPRKSKVALLAALAVIANPLIDWPAWIPVLGETEALALALVVVETFIDACPEDIRREHEQALQDRTSIWDRDVRDTVSIARHGLGRLVDRIRSRARQDEFHSMSEVV